MNLDSLPARLLTLMLLHGLWLGLLTAALVALALRCIPGAWRAARHALWLAALAVVALAPPVLTAVQSHCSARENQRTELVFISTGSKDPASSIRPRDARADAPPSLSPAWSAGRFTLEVARGIDQLQPVLLAAWLVVAVPLLLRVGLGLVAGPRRRRSARAAAPALQERCDTLARRLGMRHTPRVMIHPHVHEPCLCGLVRPWILLPEAWLDRNAHTPARIDAVLAHELAHARRRDLPVILLQRVLEAVWWFHPSVRWLSLSLHDHRERCADAMAATLTGNRLALAESLESLARWRLECVEQRRSRPFPLGAWLGGPDRSLLSRIQEVLGMTPKRDRLRWWTMAAVPLAVVGALFTVSSRLAQSRPTPSDNPPVSHDHRFDIRGKRADHPVDPNRQIAFECRLITVKAGAWQSGLNDRLIPVEGRAAEPMWILDEASQRRLYENIQQDPRSNLVQTPKVTAFEGDPVDISMTQKVRYIAALEPIPLPSGSVSFRPRVKELADGLQIGFRGTMRPQASDLEVNLHRLELLRFDTVAVPAQGTDGVTVNGSVQVPHTIEVDRQARCALPEGSALLVSLGDREIRPALSGTHRAAVEVLASVGIDIAPPARMEELLVLIKPRHILLEEEDQALGLDTNGSQPEAVRPNP